VTCQRRPSPGRGRHGAACSAAGLTPAIRPRSQCWRQRRQRPPLWSTCGSSGAAAPASTPLPQAARPRRAPELHRARRPPLRRRDSRPTAGRWSPASPRPTRVTAGVLGGAVRSRSPTRRRTPDADAGGGHGGVQHQQRRSHGVQGDRAGPGQPGERQQQRGGEGGNCRPQPRPLPHGHPALPQLSDHRTSHRDCASGARVDPGERYGREGEGERVEAEGRVPAEAEHQCGRQRRARERGHFSTHSAEGLSGLDVRFVDRRWHLPGVGGLEEGIRRPERHPR